MLMYLLKLVYKYGGTKFLSYSFYGYLSPLATFGGHDILGQHGGERNPWFTRESNPVYPLSALKRVEFI